MLSASLSLLNALIVPQSEAAPITDSAWRPFSPATSIVLGNLSVQLRPSCRRVKCGTSTDAMEEPIEFVILGTRPDTADTVREYATHRLSFAHAAFQGQDSLCDCAAC